MNLDKELIETVLRNHGHSYTVQRVVSMEYEDALTKGENYLSVIYRITLKVILGNGRPAKKSLILKVVPPEKAKSEFTQDLGVFKSETMMYTRVLREMEMLIDEFGDTNDLLWCNLIHYEPYTSLLLEDLTSYDGSACVESASLTNNCISEKAGNDFFERKKRSCKILLHPQFASGFKITKRQVIFDLDHTLLILRSLGRFHAMAKILETRGFISKEDFKPYPSLFDRNLIKKFLYDGLQVLVAAIEKLWGPEWYDVAQKLKFPCEVLQENLIALGKQDENGFYSLNHGDCWSNNMMFKYDWQNRPYTMRFVDYQIVHYNSICVDIVRLLYVSCHPSFRKDKLDTLLSTYHSSLQDTLKFYGYEGKIPTLEWLHLDFERLAFMGHVDAMWKFITCSDNPDAWNLELFIKSDGAEGIDLEAYNNKYVRSITDEDIRNLANVYIPAACEKFKTLVQCP